MRLAITIGAMSMLTVAVGQVHLDQPVQFEASDSTQRQVQGLGEALQENALITLGAARSGALHFATVGGTSDTIQLSLDPPATSYTNGLALRFLPIAANTGAVVVDVDGLGMRGLLRPDLLPPSVGQLAAGTPVEIIYIDSVFLLTSRLAEGCPEGYAQVNARFCIEQNANVGQRWFDAVQYCTDRGARLCSWDEYYHACSLLTGSLNGLFLEWEWIDDTADHSHTAVQMGRYTCASERSIATLDIAVANSRCCYRLR